MYSFYLLRYSKVSSMLSKMNTDCLQLTREYFLTHEAFLVVIGESNNF